MVNTARLHIVVSFELVQNNWIFETPFTREPNGTDPHLARIDLPPPLNFLSESFGNASRLHNGHATIPCQMKPFQTELCWEAGSEFAVVVIIT